jgi:hypothetical protein
MHALATVAAQTCDLAIALIVLIAAILFVPLAMRISQRAFDPFEPIVLFAAVYGAMFVIRPSAMLIRDDLVYEGPRTTLDISGTSTEMLVLALLGALGFVGGYLSPAGPALARRAPGLQGPRDIRVTGLVAFVVGTAGIAVFTFALASARGLDSISLYFHGRSAEVREALGASSFYPWAATFAVVPSTIAVAAVAWARRSWRFALLALVLAAVLLLRALPTGSRLLLLPFLGALFVLYFLRRRTRPGLLPLIAIAILALVASAVLSDFRSRGDRDENAITSVRNTLTNPTRAVAPFTTGPDVEMAAPSSEISSRARFPAPCGRKSPGPRARGSSPRFGQLKRHGVDYTRSFRLYSTSFGISPILEFSLA